VQTLASAVDHAEEEQRACFSLANAVPAEGELLVSPWKPAHFTTTATLKGAPGKDQMLFESGCPTVRGIQTVGIANLRATAETDRAVREQPKFENRLLGPTNLLESATYKMRKSIERLVQG